MLLIIKNLWRNIINDLLIRSAKFEEKIIHVLSQPPYDDSDRIHVSKILCSVSLEHAESLKILLASNNFTSAIGLLRLQFESLVRAVWVFYVATDIAVCKLTAELNYENIKRSEKLPIFSEMLKKLEAKAPKNAVAPILEFKEYSWKPLNSFVHGGLHAIDRHSKGYPLEFLVQALKASNGVNGLVGMFSAVLTGNKALVKEVSHLYVEFEDCFIARTK